MILKWKDLFLLVSLQKASCEERVKWRERDERDLDIRSLVKCACSINDRAVLTLDHLKYSTCLFNFRVHCLFLSL